MFITESLINIILYLYIFLYVTSENLRPREARDTYSPKTIGLQKRAFLFSNFYANFHEYLNSEYSQASTHILVTSGDKFLEE